MSVWCGCVLIGEENEGGVEILHEKNRRTVYSLLETEERLFPVENNTDDFQQETTKSNFLFFSI